MHNDDMEMVAHAVHRAKARAAQRQTATSMAVSALIEKYATRVADLGVQRVWELVSAAFLLIANAAIAQGDQPSHATFAFYIECCGERGASHFLGDEPHMVLLQRAWVLAGAVRQRLEGKP